MIRVGSLYDMTLIKEPHVDCRTGQTPDQQLSAIFQAVTPLYKLRGKTVEQLEKRLRTCNICRMTMEEMDTKERKQVENWFRDELQPILSPQVVDARHPFPHLSNKVLNIVLRLQPTARTPWVSSPSPPACPLLRAAGAGRAVHPHRGRAAGVRQAALPRLYRSGKAVCSVTRNADISPEDEPTTWTRTTASTCARS